MKVSHGLLLVAALASAAFCERTLGDVIAYDNTTVAPNQNWSGNLGLDFNVNSPISVTALGSFFGDDINNLSGGVEVAIFDRTSGIQVGSAVTINNANYTSVVNGDAFISLSSPIALGIGDYSVVSLLDPNFNEGFFSTLSNPTSTENSGGAISFVGGGRYDSNGSLDLPANIDSGPTNRYDAGTFQFVSVPLPSAVWGGLGLVASLFAARKMRYVTPTL